MPERADPFAAGLWAATSQRVEEVLGLHYAPPQWADLQRGLGVAAVRLGLPDAAAYARRLLLGPVGDDELQVLSECLAIGETYLFRDPALLEQVACEILLPLARSRADSTRHLALWSAGCSTGEEAWSLAMLVATLVPDWRDWNISILGTDINAAALARARAGVYGAWSLRGDVPPQAAHFLRPLPRGRHEVDASLHRMVRFEQLNLLDESYPSAVTRTTDIDLVLCRNVLLYFTQERSRAVLSRLGRALSPEGWLVANAMELPLGQIPGLQRVDRGALAALRRQPALLADAWVDAGGPEYTTDTSWSPADPPAFPAAAAWPPAAPPGFIPAPPPHRFAQPVSARPDAGQPHGAVALARQARACADAGELERAEQLCRAAVDADKLQAEWTWLLAAILTERGAWDEAAVALQRTLYLEPDHLLARITLGRLALRQGHVAEARRQFARVLARLAHRRPQEVVAGSGGLTAGELGDMLRRAEAVAP